MVYAEAKIAHYWIVNLPDRHLASYSQPDQNAQGQFHYLSKQIFLPHQSIPIPGFEDVGLEVNRISPERAISG
jgi:Uma2 family endonuclease